MEVLCETGGFAVVVESSSVLVVTYGEASSSLTYEGFVAVWAG
jgi:hypothetical protein